MIDSSPSTAESSFRELDDVFLQTQTRIWVGEVLCTRLDEDLNLSNLLQDGEILFEVSKVLWNLLLAKCMELRHLKHKYGPLGSRKSSGRYRPYSNVDSFIKICKILGLSGIDLFSPSDVVEKRNIRKVCICIRALSKKARSKQLSVPDFDMVVYSVTMSKNMVDVIRKSLESPQCTVSSSSSHSLKAKQLQAPSNGDDDDNTSDESDEVESRYMGENSFPSAGKFDDEPKSSPQWPCTHEFSQNYSESPSLSQKIDHSSQPHLQKGHKLDKMLASGGVSHLKRHGPENGAEGTLDYDYSIVGDSSCLDAGESSYISNYLASLDLMVNATEWGSSVIRDRENNMFDFFLNVDSSQGVSSDKKSFQNEDEDTELSSTTSMSSVLGRLLNLEFEDQFNADDSLSTNGRLSVSKEHEAKKQFTDSFLSSESDYQAVVFSSGEAEFGERDIVVVDYNKETLMFLQDESTGNLNSSLLRSDSAHLQCRDFHGHVSNEKSDLVKFLCDSRLVEGNERCEEQCKDINVSGFSDQDTSLVVPENLCETISKNHLCSQIEGVGGAQDNAVVHNISGAPENGGQDKNIPNRRKNGIPIPLLRTVVKGTAIAGILFLLLRIRKGKGDTAEETKQYNQVLKYSEPKKTSVTKGIYPSEKLRL